MAYSPFDMASLPELGGADSINLEEELQKITGLEDVALNSDAKGSILKSSTAEPQPEETHHSSESNDAILELSLDSIIQRVESQEQQQQHITIEHALDGSATLVVQPQQQGKKRAHDADGRDAAKDDDHGDDDDHGAEGTATKRRRLDPASDASEAPAAAAVAGGEAESATVATEELELSWSWGDDGEEVVNEDDDASIVDPPKRVSALLAEVAKVEDVELKGEEEEKLAKELNGNLNRENPFELPIIIRQRRVARLRKRAEVHQRKIKQILTSWDIAPLKRP